MVKGSSGQCICTRAGRNIRSGTVLDFSGVGEYSKPVHERNQSHWMKIVPSDLVWYDDGTLFGWRQMAWGSKGTSFVTSQAILPGVGFTGHSGVRTVH